MTSHAILHHSPLWRRLRWAVWGGAAALLLLPLVAMRFATGVNWTGLDFAVMGVMLGAACLAFELAVRVGRSHAYVLGAGVGTAAAFLTVWSNLAVGIVGDEGAPANLMFHGVVLVALAGVALSRLEPRRLALAMMVAAFAQLAAALATWFLGEAREFMFTAMFAALWLVSAQLFRQAARAQATAR